MSSTVTYPPVAPALTRRDIAKQFWLDVYGKEVQSAATYSYMWMADQAGHMGIGILLDFAFTALIPRLATLLGWPWRTGSFSAQVAGVVVTGIIVGLWELSAYRADVRKAKGSIFPLQTGLLQHNAVAAAAYMALGGVIGWALHQDPAYSFPIVALLFVVVVLTAVPWLRQKIIWQKAALPYLARLADFRPRIPAETAQRLWQRIIAPPPPGGGASVVVIGGPAGSGRSLLACSIGTEWAFQKASVRYLGFNHLMELDAARDYDRDPWPGPANIQYWPWSRAQVLIIDDLGPLISAISPDDARAGTLALGEVLARRIGTFRETLALRHTIWILGYEGAQDLDQLQRSAEAIAGFLGVADPLSILLSAETVVSRVG